ncbi:HAD-IA family hydrolase [Hyphococcus sp.]|uniref:HAD-IA family hydrolase n=1 Tax=Hyphococcus sp. TaxID=2038636 RepID=UPI003CCBA7C6
MTSRDGEFSGACLLFDLDGTLVDTAEDLAASMNFALSEAGLDPAPGKDVRHLVGHGARRMLMRGYELSAGRDASDEELDRALELFLDHYQHNIAVHSRPFEGVVALIENLRRRGAQMAICTNKREAMARLLLETLEIAALFDCVVGADTAPAPKPDPAPVLLCLEKTNASRAVFIGDSDTDIRAAAAAGLPCYVADFGYGPVTQPENAAAMFSQYADLQPVIEQSLRG